MDETVKALLCEIKSQLQANETATAALTVAVNRHATREAETGASFGRLADGLESLRMSLKEQSRRASQAVGAAKKEQEGLLEQMRKDHREIARRRAAQDADA